MEDHFCQFKKQEWKLGFVDKKMAHTEPKFWDKPLNFWDEKSK